VELAVREAELAQLRRALSNRVWIEQAKGVLAVTQGVTPEAAFGQLRARGQIRAAPAGRPGPGGGAAGAA
jgi:AmiR/NasT family two-component response regulator